MRGSMMPVQAHQFQVHAPIAGAAVPTRRGFGDDLETARFERRERGQRRRNFVGRQLGAQDARELSRQMRHPAFQAVAVVRGDHARDQLDQAGAIGAEQGQHEIGHWRENTLSRTALPQAAFPHPGPLPQGGRGR